MLLMQLEKVGVLIREGAIVDASIIASACRPRKVTEMVPEHRNETDLNKNITIKSVKISYSKDRDLCAIAFKYSFVSKI